MSNDKAQPGPLLHGARVVELGTGIALSYCGKLFADAGATVVKLEPPSGDPMRRHRASGPVPDGEDGALFTYLNASKRSVVGSVAPRDDMSALLAGAHLLIEDGALTSDEIMDLRRLFPELSIVSITPLGRTGRWSGLPTTEFTLQAMCGSIGVRGDRNGQPLQAGGQLGEWIGGVYAAVAGVTVYRQWRTLGRADHADVSIMECMALTMSSSLCLDPNLVEFAMGEPMSLTRAVELPSIEPTADGYVGFCLVTAQQFADFLVMIDRGDLLDDRELATAAGRQRRAEEFNAIVHAWTTQRKTDDIIELATAFRIPTAPIGEPATIPNFDHFVDRDVYITGESGLRQPRRPYLVDGEEPPVPGPAPTIGEGTDSIAWEPLLPPNGEASHEALPLDGVRVVDLTAFWAGPGATQMMGALGADVIKVESTRRPDAMRFFGVRNDPDVEWWETGATFHVVNQNKRGVTLDLTSEVGRSMLLELLADADVFIENFSPRVLDSFGLTAEVLHEANRRLIVVRMPAFGLAGPWRDRTGFAQTMEQMSGMAWITGQRDSAPVIPRGPCDPIAGMHAAFAVLAALCGRIEGGMGCTLECTMAEAALNVAAEIVLEYEVYGETLQRNGNRGPAALQGVYRCSDDDGFVAIAIENDAHWTRLCELLDDRSLMDDYADATHRRAGADDIDERILAWTVGYSRDRAFELLAGAGIPAAPVVNQFVGTVDHLRDRRFPESFSHRVVGEHRVLGIPFRLASRGEESWMRRPAPTLGEHNDEVFMSLLGRSAGELRDREAAGVIGNRPWGA
ncbi:MAG TPA: CoA transferase [Solirubrobacteraceae bacterium]|nr:CoA transferase [Solirubrobacteraceae bacterium]